MQSEEPQGSVRGGGATPIAYWRTGQGPAVVLVHGTTSDHTTYDELVPHLAAGRTVYTYDRRGRGHSGDAASYAFEDEIADAVAVIRRAAEDERGPVPVFGHSFGAFIALLAAQRSGSASAVVAYSPGFGAEYREQTLEEIERASASDDMDTALRIMFADVIGMTEDDIDFMADSPAWAVRVAIGHTIARECRADSDYLTRYREELAAVSLPILIIDGLTNNAPKRRIARTLWETAPNARIHEMAGQGHAAHHRAPAELAALSIRFFDEPDSDLAPAASGSS